MLLPCWQVIAAGLGLAVAFGLGVPVGLGVAVSLVVAVGLGVAVGLCVAISLRVAAAPCSVLCAPWLRGSTLLRGRDSSLAASTTSWRQTSRRCPRWCPQGYPGVSWG